MKNKYTDWIESEIFAFLDNPDIFTDDNNAINPTQGQPSLGRLPANTLKDTSDPIDSLKNNALIDKIRMLKNTNQNLHQKCEEDIKKINLSKEIYAENKRKLKNIFSTFDKYKGWTKMLSGNTTLLAIQKCLQEADKDMAFLETIDEYPQEQYWHYIFAFMVAMDSMYDENPDVNIINAAMQIQAADGRFVSKSTSVNPDVSAEDTLPMTSRELKKHRLQEECSELLKANTILSNKRQKLSEMNKFFKNKTHVVNVLNDHVTKNTEKKRNYYNMDFVLYQFMQHSVDDLQEKIQTLSDEIDELKAGEVLRTLI